jgi:hypothetical protein
MFASPHSDLHKSLTFQSSFPDVSEPVRKLDSWPITPALPIISAAYVEDKPERCRPYEMSDVSLGDDP